MDNPPNVTPPQTSSSSLYDLMKCVLDHPTLKPKEKKKLIDELRKSNPAASDRWAYRWTIWILGASVVITIICVTYLAAMKVEVPDGLIAIGSAVAGGIAGLLTPPPKTNKDD